MCVVKRGFMSFKVFCVWLNVVLCRSKWLYAAISGFIWLEVVKSGFLIVLTEVRHIDIKSLYQLCVFDDVPHRFN